MILDPLIQLSKNDNFQTLEVGKEMRRASVATGLGLLFPQQSTMDATGRFYSAGRLSVENLSEVDLASADKPTTPISFLQNASLDTGLCDHLYY